MITITVFIGSSFDGGQEYDDFQFPAVPRIGEKISTGSGKRAEIRDVEYVVNRNGEVLVRVLIPAAGEPFDMRKIL